MSITQMTETRITDRKRRGALPLITDEFVSDVCGRLEDGQVVRRPLPYWGRIHVEGQLPFLCLYRRPKGGDETRTERLIQGEASFVLAEGSRQHARGLSSLVGGVGRVMTRAFGSVLVVEVWTGVRRPDEETFLPSFRLHYPKQPRLDSTVDVLSRSLEEITIKGQRAVVERCEVSKVAPPGFPSLIQSADREHRHHLGIEVRPVHWDPSRREVLPLVWRALHRKFSVALKRCVFEFTRSHTDHRPPHYHALGRRSIVKAVWMVDEQLAEVSNGFDFLMLISPTNTDPAWREFHRRRFQEPPDFSYRALPIDPALAKRQLFRVPIERIEDPTLAQLFRDQQAELDRKLTMLSERGTPRFLPGSLQLFGGVDKSLSALARRLLKQIPRRSRRAAGKAISAEAFAARASSEIEYYRRRCPDVTARVRIRADVSGLMVSRGNLLVGKRTAIPQGRVESLLSHEIGTHVLTYFNGRAQPFRQLYVGLPNYEELQEGLAVLSEFLVGGLTRQRVRLLAARVLAAERLIDGASFVDVFRELVRKHGFAQRVAFGITMRVFRCGGLTKDVVYLRGLVRLLQYLGDGGNLDLLFVGKFGVEHVSIIQELQWRHVLKPPPLRPRHLDHAEAQNRLEHVRRGVSVLELVS